MKLRVDRDVFADAVTWTARSLPARPALPVLAGVRLEAVGTSLTLTSFDFEVSAQVEVPADVEEDGVVLVSGRLLADIAKALPNRPVDLELQGSKVAITCGSSQFSLSAMAADEYPALPAMPSLAGTIDAHDLAQAVSQVSLAASRDDTLPLLSSVQMVIEGDSITFMATDRYRLAVRQMNWNAADKSVNTKALLKAKTLSDVAKSLTSTGEVEMSMSSDTGSSPLIGFQAGGRRTTSVLTDGDYPPVMRLFPENTTIHATVAREELIAAVKRVSLVAQRGATIRMAFSQGNLSLSAGTGDDASASEQLQAHLEGEDFETAFNYSYMVEGMAAITQPYVRFAFTHPAQPAFISGMDEIGGEADMSFRYLIMPIRFGA